MDITELRMPKEVSAQLTCPIGCWCTSDGTRYPCPPGRAGTEVAEIRPRCARDCDAGYFCPAASTNTQMFQCGGSALFCPAGSFVPTVSQRGYFTYGGTEMTRVNEAPCAAGYYCQSGMPFICPPGRFGNRTGEFDSECSGTCERGHFCDAGATSAQQHLCGATDLYCPTGSSAPYRVDTGFFSVRLAFGFRLPVEVTDPASSDLSKYFALLSICGSDTRDMSYVAPAYIGAGAPDMDIQELASRRTVGPSERALVQDASLGNLTLFVDTGVAQAGLSRAQLCSYAARTMILEGTVDIKLMNTFFVSATWEPASELRRDAQLPCPQGFYCMGGRRYICPAARYGERLGLSDPLCTGICAPGYYCPAGSVRATQNVCGAKYVICPEASGEPTGVQNGYYSTRFNEDYIIRNKYTLEKRVYINETIRALNPTTRTEEHLCAPGTFCRAGVAYICPVGRYGSIFGSVSPICDGPCTPGFFCSEGNIEPRQHKCGNATFYCPEGSGEPNPSFTGYYTAGGLTDITGGRMLASTAVVCNDTYGDDDLTYPAAARPEYPSSMCAGLGRNVDGSLNVSSVWLSIHGTAGMVKAETDCRVERSPLLGPTVTTFHRKRRCYGGMLGDEDTRTYQIQCEPGSFCWYGLRFECIPGRYGNVSGLANEDCSGLCAPGHWCPWASVSATERECGGPDVYCPAGSGAPSPVDIGFYTDPTEPPTKKTRQIMCEPGFYCIDGIRYPCPSGQFGSSYGLATSRCTGECMPGFFCPTNSSSATQVQCGITRGPSVFCPPASSRPKLAADGFYTIGGFDKRINYPQNTTRVAEIGCEEGNYCIGGIKYQCPAGTYGELPFLKTRTCSGLCEPGYFCPPGSGSRRQYRCGDVYIMLVDALRILTPAQNVTAATLDGTLSVPFPAPPLLNDSSYDFRAIFKLFDFLRNGTGVSGGFNGAGSSGAYREYPGVPILSANDPKPIPLQSGYDCAALESGEVITAVSRVTISATKDLTLHLVNVTAAPGLSCLNGTMNITVSPVTEGIAIDVHLPWEGGVRTKLPAVTVNIESLATIHRLLLVGGPSAVYCPRGSGFPTPVPLGSYSLTTAEAMGMNITKLKWDYAYSLPNFLPGFDDVDKIGWTMPLAPPNRWDPLNMTRDVILPAEPGYFAVAGTKYPCNPGLYGNATGLFIRTCSGWCPPGFECPLASALPLPCPDGYYAPGGLPRCLKCPGPSQGNNAGSLNAGFVSKEKPAVPGALDGTNTLPNTAPITRCKHARYCCNL